VKNKMPSLLLDEKICLVRHTAKFLAGHYLDLVSHSCSILGFFSSVGQEVVHGFHVWLC
jgi:hypothetical protein